VRRSADVITAVGAIGSDARALRDAMAAIPSSCYRRSTLRGCAYLARDAAVFAAATVALAHVDVLLLLIPLWLIAGLAMGALFVIGHDAAHEALFDRPWLNAIVGRLALLPSLHAHAVWALGHNRLHHGHTGCADVDFVWHPTSPMEFAAAPWWWRCWHRLEWSAVGAGPYYVRAIWWRRMVRAVTPPRVAAACRRDRWLVAAYATAVTTAVVYTAAPGMAVWAWCKVVLVPWLVWTYSIGVTVYVHHIAPEIRWHRRSQWTRCAGQVDGTATYRIAPWLNVFWHNVYLHTPHHVDPRVPFYHLPAAARALAARYPDSIRIRRYRLRDYLWTTQRCKLFDFDREVWVGYEAANRSRPEPAHRTQA
jgi:omega-6 fatty acid desaturase (delta-12 desaturase)